MDWKHEQAYPDRSGGHWLHEDFRKDSTVAVGEPSSSSVADADAADST